MPDFIPQTTEQRAASGDIFAYGGNRINSNGSATAVAPTPSQSPISVNNPPASPVSVVTAQPAIDDYNKKQVEFQNIQQGIQNQATTTTNGQLPNLNTLQEGQNFNVNGFTYTKTPDGSFKQVGGSGTAPTSAAPTDSKTDATAVPPSTPSKSQQVIDILSKTNPDAAVQMKRSREDALQGLVDQGISNTGEMLNYLNASGGDFTPEEVNQYFASKGITPSTTIKAPGKALSEWQKGQIDYQAQKSKLLTDLMDTYSQYKNGTMPLNPSQQAQVDLMQQMTLRTIAAQERANKNYEAGVTQVGISEGRSRYAPTLALGEIKQAVDDGLAKINDIQTKSMLAVAQMSEAFRTNNFELANKAFETFNKGLDDIQKSIDNVYEKNHQAEQEAIAAERDARDFAAKETQRKFDNTMTSNRFTFDQKKQAFDEVMQNQNFTLEQKKFAQTQWKDQQEIEMRKKELNAKLTAGSSGADLTTAQLAAQEYASTGKMPSWVTKEMVPMVALLSRSVQQPEGRLVSSITGQPATTVSAKRTDAINALKDSIANLDTMKKAFEGMHTGVFGKLGDLNPSDERVLYDTMKNEFLSKLLVARSGAAVTEQEYARYANQVPGDWNSPLWLGASGEDKLTNLKNSLEGNLNTVLRTDGLKFIDNNTAQDMSDEELMNSALGTDANPANEDPIDYFENLNSQLNQMP